MYFGLQITIKQSQKFFRANFQLDQGKIFLRPFLYRKKFASIIRIDLIVRGGNEIFTQNYEYIEFITSIIRTLFCCKKKQMHV